MSTGIRACTRDDLPAVASLYERVSRSGARTAAPGLAAYFGRTLFDDPWADPELPSLVLEADGRVLGFVGVHARRAALAGRPLRMAVTAHLATDPDAGRRGGGALLLRRALAGPQDLTVSSGGPEVARMWESLGGRALPVTSANWVRLFGPARTAANVALPPRWRRRARPLLGLVDRALPARWPVPAPPAGTRAEPLTPAAVREHLPRLAGPDVLRPAYDEPFLRWLLAEMAAVRARGVLTARLVRAEDRVLGWYVAHLHPREASQVLSVQAAEADVPAVLDHLVRDAHASGTPLLLGRVEPHLWRSLWARRALLARAGADLVHARDADVLAALGDGRSVLSRMEGEGWMGHAHDPLP